MSLPSWLSSNGPADKNKNKNKNKNQNQNQNQNKHHRWQIQRRNNETRIVTKGENENAMGDAMADAVHVCSLTCFEIRVAIPNIPCQISKR
jgi:hypothetical protein